MELNEHGDFPYGDELLSEQTEVDTPDELLEQEMEFRDRVLQTLVDSIKDFLTFASVEDLKQLIEEECL